MTAVRPVLRHALVVALVTALLLPLLPTPSAEAVDDRTIATIRDRVEYLVNRERAQRGLRRLRVHDRTQYWARDHSIEMSRRGTIYHDSRLGYEVPAHATAYGENVARTSAGDAARAAMNMFMASSGHRENILHRPWRRMGIGIAKRGGYVYITQRFFTS